MRTRKRKYDVLVLEPEVHGEFVRQLGDHLGGCTPGVVVDGSGFRDRVGDADRRLAERQRAWERVLGEVGATPVFVELDRPLPPEVVEHLGAALAVIETRSAEAAP